MNRTNLFAVAALALGMFACDRNADRASETKTTSASQPADNTGITTPAAPQADPNLNLNLNADDAKDAGHASITTGTTNPVMNAKDGGHRALTDTMSGKPTGSDGPDHTNLDRNRNTVAPGHITTPPDHGRATGAPNSDGSHNIGAGGSPTR